MINLVMAVIILAAVALALRYVHKSRKEGRKCIGCPSGGGCECHCHEK